MRYTTRYTSAVAALVLVVGAVALGCDKKENGEAAADRSAADAPKPGAAATAPKDLKDLTALCDQICEKTGECGGAMARSMLEQTGQKGALAEQAIAEAATQAKAGVGDCKKMCAKDVGKEAARPEAAQAMAAVRKCLGEKECGPFIKCMEAADPNNAGHEAPQP